MKVLVTGGAGFIGSHVVDRCVAAGCDVVVVDNLSTGRRESVNPAAKLVVVDIRSPKLAEVFQAERPDALIHHAAQAEVRGSVDDPLFDADVNVLGSLNLLQCCRRFGVTRVVYASSGGAAYGDTTRLPTPEDHPTRPASPYGVSKITVEHYLGCWPELRGLALRYANVYGPRQSPGGEAGVVAIFAHRLLRGLPACINGDGLQTRDYVYVDDIADANMAALAHPDVTGVVNLGTGLETTVTGLFDRLRALVDRPAMAEHGPPKPGEQRRSVLDAALARRRLGWTPRVSLDEGLRRTIQHFAADMRGAARAGANGTVPA
jgi:UDP-glucose 4-epimerase